MRQTRRCSVPNTPFTRYNRLSNQFYNRFDSRLDSRLDNMLNRVNVVEHNSVLIIAHVRRSCLCLCRRGSHLCAIAHPNLHTIFSSTSLNVLWWSRIATDLFSGSYGVGPSAARLQVNSSHGHVVTRSTRHMRVSSQSQLDNKTHAMPCSSV